MFLNGKTFFSIETLGDWENLGSIREVTVEIGSVFCQIWVYTDHLSILLARTYIEKMNILWFDNKALPIPFHLMYNTYQWIKSKFVIIEHEKNMRPQISSLRVTFWGVAYN